MNIPHLFDHGPGGRAGAEDAAVTMDVSGLQLSSSWKHSGNIKKQK